MSFYDEVSASARYIAEHSSTTPEIGVILGSGLGGLVESMEGKETIPYREIPHFPVSSVSGHAGNLVVGRLSGRQIIVMQGRFHFYEGFSMREVAYPIYVMKQLGVKALIVTNACGGINTAFEPGDLMLLTDFINSAGSNPLIGENDERFGPRFPDMSEPYARTLIAQAEAVADQLGISYQHGVYAIHQGPYYETAAEIRMYKALGADAVGMSTVPETIAANYLGIRTLGISCITNMATGLRTGKHSYEEVLKIASGAGERLSLWIRTLIPELKL